MKTLRLFIGGRKPAKLIAMSADDGKGRRTGMSDGTGATAWSYDPAGRVLTKRQTIAGVTKSIGYTYNRDGSVASRAL